MTESAGLTMVVAQSETELILPPPNPLNPIPALPAALRLENQEQLLALLQSNPHGSSGSSTFRQLLVFGNDSLRTLLLRQVLSDPHTRTFKANKTKNWDNVDEFPPYKNLQFLGTRLLSASETAFQTSVTIEGGAEITAAADVITYFLNASDLTQTQAAAQRIRSFRKTAHTHHRLVYLPQPTAIVQRMLTNAGVTSMSNVSIHKLQCDLFPIETDIISLEYDDALKECNVEGTPSTLITACARSLLKLQDVIGKIPRIQAYGALGEEVTKSLLHLTVNDYLQGQPSTEMTACDAAALIIMDRKVDWVTPMLTPLTYEGLLDDVVGIDCGFLHVDSNVIQPEEDEKKIDHNSSSVALGLNGSDALYAEVRDQHVEKFGSFLQNQAKALQETHANFTSRDKKKKLDEIQQFVKQIPIFTKNLRSLTNHIHLAELVKHTSEEATFREQWQLERSMLEGETAYDQLEELVASQYPPYRFFRLLCLQSLTAGGIKSSRYDAIRRDVVQTYGYEYLFVLTSLETAGLLSRREGLWLDTASPFSSLRRSLILINAEVDTVEPDDISYVSSGYAPLSVRLIQTAVKGWNINRDEILKEIPGRLVDIVQQSPPEDMATAMRRPVQESLGSLASSSSVQMKKPTLIVFYVGGVTYMELAALRFLSKRPTFPFHIICLTTKIINGDRLLQTLARQ
jgi:hypothetical protein